MRLLTITFTLAAFLLSGQARAAAPVPLSRPVYHIPLRVHLAESSRPVAEFRAIFTEINDIWSVQAGICFDIEAVRTDEEADAGLEMWFRPAIGGLNGSFDGEVILMKDHPVLAPAPHPARDSAARTAAHELGHALDLHHDQSASENLMASKTYGWRLNPLEINEARRQAAELASFATDNENCANPSFVP